METPPEPRTERYPQVDATDVITPFFGDVFLRAMKDEPAETWVGATFKLRAYYYLGIPGHVINMYSADRCAETFFHIEVDNANFPLGIRHTETVAVPDGLQLPLLGLIFSSMDAGDPVTDPRAF